jgi:hypothetical protein
LSHIERGFTADRPAATEALPGGGEWSLHPQRCRRAGKRNLAKLDYGGFDMRADELNQLREQKKHYIAEFRSMSKRLEATGEDQWSKKVKLSDEEAKPLLKEGKVSKE